MRKFILAMLLVVGLAGLSYAAVEVQSSGTKVGKIDKLNFVGPQVSQTGTVMTVNSANGLKSIEETSAGDTLTIADCDKTFIVTAATTLTYNLPTNGSTLAGCEYKWIAADGGAIKKIAVNPGNSDILRGVVNSSAATTFAVGDSVISPGNTNDTIAVISNGGTIWDVSDIRGTWADNN